MKTITPLSNNKATVISKINITRDGIDITYRSRIIVKHANKLAMEYYLPENGYLIKNLAAGEYYIHSITPGEGIMIKLPPEKTAFKVDSNNHIYYIGNIDVDLTGKAHSGMRLNGSSIGKGSTSDMIFFFIVVAGVIIANEIAAKKPGEQYINFYDDGNEIQEYFKKTSGDSLIVERSLMRAIE